MNRWFARFGVPLAGRLRALAGCDSNKSANPLSPTVAGPIPGVHHRAQAARSVERRKRSRPTSQPITLMVENASTTGVRPLEYLFEVASDSGSHRSVFARDGITPGDGTDSLRYPTHWRRDTPTTGAHARRTARTPDRISAPTAFQVVQPIIDRRADVDWTGGRCDGDREPAAIADQEREPHPVRWARSRIRSRCRRTTPSRR